MIAGKKYKFTVSWMKNPKIGYPWENSEGKIIGMKIFNKKGELKRSVSIEDVYNIQEL